MEKKFIYVTDPKEAVRLKEDGYHLLKKTDQYWIYLNETHSKSNSVNFDSNKMKDSNILTF